MNERKVFTISRGLGLCSFHHGHRLETLRGGHLHTSPYSGRARRGACILHSRASGQAVTHHLVKRVTGLLTQGVADFRNQGVNTDEGQLLGVTNIPLLLFDLPSSVW